MIDRSGCSGSRHGTSNAYRNHRCRCPDARRANTTYNKRRRAGVLEPQWVSTVGVTRRRQALAAIGYGLRELAPFFGTSWRGVGNYMMRPRVHRSTFERWVNVYDLLSMTPGPNEKAREHARRQGWAPPLAWDDDRIDDPEARPARMPRAWANGPNLKVVEACLAGDEEARAKLRPVDRWHIVRELHAQGLTDPQIAARAGMAIRTIWHIRSQLCLSSNFDPQRARAG